MNQAMECHTHGCAGEFHRWAVFFLFEDDSIPMSEQVHASHILVKKEEEAKEIIVRIEAGEEFAAIARQSSLCPSGQTGGDLGWFGKGVMVPDFEKACFSAEKGTIAGPVQTQFGWHVIQVLETK
jgi:peptidyl-prolyl cis-trans isomerase C